MGDPTDERAQTGRWRPRFLKEIQAEIDSSGLVDATHRLLQRDGVQVKVEGHIDSLVDHDGGLLLVGDHKNQWEFVAAIELVNRIGRTDMLNVAKFYVGRQIEYALGAKAASHVIPVYPKLLARDRCERLNPEIINRIAFRRSLLSLDESAKVNAETLVAASDALVAGGVVNIFPCGGIVDALQSPWRRGVGSIIENISETDAGEVLIVPYRVDNIRRIRLLATVMLRGKGLAGRPQSLNLQFGRLCTAAELVQGLELSQETDPSQRLDHSVQITAELRKQFVEHFGGTDG